MSPLTRSLDGRRIIAASAGALLQYQCPMVSLAPGKTVSHYRIIETLGHGGQATAYKAEDLRLSRPVVIKALRQQSNLIDAGVADIIDNRNNIAVLRPEVAFDEDLLL